MTAKELVVQATRKARSNRKYTKSEIKKFLDLSNSGLTEFQQTFTHAVVCAIAERLGRLKKRRRRKRLSK